MSKNILFEDKQVGTYWGDREKNSKIQEDNRMQKRKALEAKLKTESKNFSKSSIKFLKNLKILIDIGYIRILFF